MTRVTGLVMMCVLALAAGAAAQPAGTLAERTRGLERSDGFLPLYWDASRGRVLVEVPVFDRDVLYFVSAASGAGSVELPFDRGILTTEVIHFQRSGPRVLVVAQTRALPCRGRIARAGREREGFVRHLGAGLAADRSRRGRRACWSTPRRSSCAMRPMWKAGCAA